MITSGVRAFDEKLVLGARARLVAEQGPRPGVTTIPFSDAYNIFDVFAEYQATEFATLNITVDNVFGKEYIQYLDLQNSPGLNARVGLTMRLGAE